MKNAISLAFLLMLTTGVMAGPDPRCQTDLGRASRLIDAVAARDRAGPIGNTARLCQTLRRNRSDIVVAAEILNRCLTGHARGENVGQLRASAADIDATIRRRCR